MTKGKVVVIDDSPIARRLAMATLSEEGFKVYTAEDGEEGFKLAEEVLPAVILVDFIMPRMNGYQFCKMVRENKLLKKVPVILITAKGEDAGEQFRKKFGICDYLIKPFEPSELIEKVNASIVRTLEDTASSCEQIAGEVCGIIDTEESPQENVMSFQGSDEVTFGASRGEDFGASDQEIRLTDLPDPSSDIQKAMEELDSFMKTNQGKGAPVQEPSEAQPSMYTASDFSEISAVPDLPKSSGLERTVESIIQNYLAKELPAVLQNSMAGILRPSGVPKNTGVILSGDLGDFNIVDVFQLIDSAQSTGSLSVYAAAVSYIVFFEKGSIVYASANNEESADTLFTGLITKKVGVSGEVLTRVQVSARSKGISFFKALAEEGILSAGDILAVLKDRTDEAVCSIIELENGKFFFERMQLSNDLLEIPIRMKPTQVILEGAKRIAKKRYLK